MKMVYSNESHFQANNVKNVLETQAINAFIKNEFSQGAVGEISAFDAWPEVWIFDDENYEPALALIASLNEDMNAQEDWVCVKCNEKNAPSFEICWSCQHEHQHE